MPNDLTSQRELIDPGPGKWYSLWTKVDPEDPREECQDVPIEELEVIGAELGTTAVGDHCYNPTVVLLWASRNGVYVPGFVTERLLGRWMIDHDNWEPEIEGGWYAVDEAGTQLAIDANTTPLEAP